MLCRMKAKHSKYMLEKLQQQILAKIKDESLSPKPRWHFLLKERLVWTFGALALSVGAAAVSVMLYLAKSNEWFILADSDRGLAAWLLLSLPYFWLVFLALFLWLLSYNLKHTRSGYRYPTILIALAAILASVILGGAFFALGLGAKIDDILGRQAPLYDRVFNPHIDLWSRPEEGRLSGLVVALTGEEHFLLADRDRGEWRVNNNDNDDLVVIGQPIRVVGKISGDREFTASKILIMKPGRSFFKRLNDDMIPSSPRFDGPGKNGMGCFNGGPDYFSELLNKYPDLKFSFEKVLLAQKSQILENSKHDKSLLPALQSLNLSQSFWQAMSSN